MTSFRPAETRAQALDDELQRLFRGLEARALPDGLKALVEQLDEAGADRGGETAAA